MQGIVLDNDVFVIEHTLPPHNDVFTAPFVIEHTLPPHNDVFTAPAVFFHYEGWGVFKSKETLAAQLRIAAVLLRKTGRSRPLFAWTGQRRKSMSKAIWIMRNAARRSLPPKQWTKSIWLQPGFRE